MPCATTLRRHGRRPGEAITRRSRREVARPVGGRRHLPLRSHEDPRRDLRDRHAAADGVRRAAHRALRVVLAQRPHGPVLADARQRGLLPDGVGRQRAQRRAPRAADARRAVRSVAALRPRLHAGRPAAEAADPGVAAQLHADLRRRRRDARGEVLRAVVVDGSVGRLVAVVHDDRSQGAARVAVRLPSAARARSRVPHRRARRCGTST